MDTYSCRAGLTGLINIVTARTCVGGDDERPTSRQLHSRMRRLTLVHASTLSVAAPSKICDRPKAGPCRLVHMLLAPNTRLWLLTIPGTDDPLCWGLGFSLSGRFIQLSYSCWILSNIIIRRSDLVRVQQDIWANAHETRDSISLILYAGCRGRYPVISAKIYSKCALQPKIANNSLKTHIFRVESRSRSSMLVPPESLSTVLVVIRAASLCLSATILVLD